MRVPVPILLILSACSVPTSETQLPAARAGADRLVLIVHGSGDTAATWAEDFATKLRARLAEPERTDVVAYDWADAAESRSSAAGNGEAEGTALATALGAREPRYTHVHVISHSVGAHVAHALTLGLAAQSPRPTIHATYLDPFVGWGLFDWSYGIAEFGRDADFAECWQNLGDGVPATDDPLELAHDFDVSALRPATGYEDSRGHWWPIDAYRDDARGLARSFEVLGTFDAAALKAANPIGATSTLTP